LDRELRGMGCSAFRCEGSQLAIPSVYFDAGRVSNRTA
jgi:hypothetical protein